MLLLTLMKCIVLYGPPAVGKLTVARELAKSGNTHVFDNHKVLELISPVIANDGELVTLSYSLQLQILNAAMRYSRVDVIFPFTFTASSQADVAFLQTMVEAAQTHSVALHLIHLRAKKRTLLERAVDPSRFGTTKITDPAMLQPLLDSYDFDSAMPGDHSMTINTTHLTAKETAQQIVRIMKPAA